jgi:hypothetical protein
MPLVSPWGCVPLLLILVEACTMFVLVNTTRWQPVLSHPDDGWLFWTGILVAVASFLFLLGAKPRTLKGLAQGLLLSAVTGLISAATLSFVAERIRQTRAFASPHLVEQVRYLRVGTASIGHGRGVSYNIDLADYPAYLQVEEADYRAAFGADEYLHPRAVCVHGRVRSTGSAMWIATANGGHLPRGSLGACSPPPAPAPRPQPYASALFRAPPTPAQQARAWEHARERSPLSRPDALQK